MTQKNRPSLENLVESVNLGLEILHPGGLEITRELAGLCRVGKDSLVLDVASGTGESACYLAEELRVKIVGVDRSEQLLARAKSKAEQRGLAVEFSQGDAHRLPFGDNTFDAVISECTLCILDKQRAIREMARVAKSGGYVGIHDICWHEDTPEAIKERLVDLERERPETLAGWKALFREAGLVEVETVDSSHLVPAWVEGIKKKLGLGRQLGIFLAVARKWGLSGLKNVLESERIFRSRHTGYGIIVGRKSS